MGGAPQGLQALQVLEDGYIFWTRGPLWFSVAQFRDNVLPGNQLAAGPSTLCVQHMWLAITCRAHGNKNFFCTCIIRGELQPEGCTLVWCHDAGLLRRLANIV